MTHKFLDSYIPPYIYIYTHVLHTQHTHTHTHTHRILPVYKIRHILHPSSTNHILVSPSGLCFLITPTICPLSTVSSIASVATHDCTTQYSISWEYWPCKKACWLEPWDWLCYTQTIFIEWVVTFRRWCSWGFCSSGIWCRYQRVIGSWYFKEALHLIFKGEQILGPTAPWGWATAPWWWENYVASKHQVKITDCCSVISQRTKSSDSLKVMFLYHTVYSETCLTFKCFICPTNAHKLLQYC